MIPSVATGLYESEALGGRVLAFGSAQTRVFGKIEPTTTAVVGGFFYY